MFFIIVAAGIELVDAYFPYIVKFESRRIPTFCFENGWHLWIINSTFIGYLVNKSDKKRTKLVQLIAVKGFPAQKLEITHAILTSCVDITRSQCHLIRYFINLDVEKYLRQCP